jgi:hypothetical protein
VNPAKLLLWHLWRGLYRFPTDHPLLRQNQIRPNALELYYSGWTQIVYGSLFILCLALMGQIISSLELPLLVVWCALLFAAGTLNGVHLLTYVTRQIARQRQSGQYDLIGMTPAGRFVAGWALAAQHVHQHTRYTALSQYASIVQVFALLAVIPVILVLTPLAMDPVPMMVGFSETVTSRTDWVGLLNGYLLIVMLRIEYMRAITSAVLLSGIVPARTTFANGAGIMAAGIFISLQVITVMLYVGALTVTRVLLHERFGVNTVLSSVLGLLAVVLIAEGVTRLLWGIVQSDLNTSPVELDSVTRSETLTVSEVKA